MDEVLRRLANNLLESCKDLLPIVLVVAFFQIIVLKQAIPEIGIILLGTLSILIGLTFFVSGLRLGLFPIGENLAHSFVNKGSLFWLLLFAFALGFGSSIAEPALMAVSQEAAIVASSGGIIENNELAINKYSLGLRLSVALAVGLSVMLGVLRILKGWPLQWLIIPGYVLVMVITFVSPDWIIGVAYDSGGVTTSTVTVPLVTALGVGLALKETLENYFAYILIRKDKVFTEGDRVQLESGYNGYVHRITPRVTYIRHALNESLAIIPTRQLVSAEMVNFTKEINLVPAIVDVGVSYLNDPKQVASILVKVGQRTLIEVKDSKGNHVAVQKRCPYLDQNKPSCGCDKDIHVDIEQPTVRFNKFNDSSLDFSVWIYVNSYGAQFKVKSAMRLIMYEEFKKYDIRIPWPIRTVYQGDEKREAQEIAEYESKRKQVMDEFGIGDLARGEGD